MTIASQTLSVMAVGKRKQTLISPSPRQILHTRTVHRIVTDLFPRSQHRPSIITHDALIKPTPSAPLLRWNFRKAHWEDFTKDTCKLLLELLGPNSPDIDDTYCQFISAIIKTAKQHIPRGHRKIYIPGWDKECARQERWVETVKAIDFTHSSRKAWSVVRQLTGEKNNKPQVPIKANKIAQHVVKNERNATVNREFTREVNKELKQILQMASVDFELCSDFTVDEMQQALRSLKSGKAAGTRFNPSRISYAPWYGMPELVKNVHDQLYATHEDTQKLVSCKDYRNPQAG